MPTRATQTAATGRQTGTQSGQRNLIYAVKRGTQVAVTIAATDIGRAANFLTLSNLPSYTEFSNLFDQFCFEQIDVEFVVPRAAVSAGNSAIFPTLVYSVDYNDSIAPTTVNDVLEFDAHRVFQFSESKRSHKFSFKPKAPLTMPTGTVNIEGPAWLSTSNAAGQAWYGFKYWLQDYNSTATNGTIVTMYVTYHAKYRIPK